MPWPGILTAGCEQNGWLAAVEKRIGCSFQEPTMTKFRGIFPLPRITYRRVDRPCSRTRIGRSGRASDRMRRVGFAGSVRRHYTASLLARCIGTIRVVVRFMDLPLSSTMRAAISRLSSATQ